MYVKYSVLVMLYDVIIGPIELIVEYIFNFFLSKFSVFGVMGAVLAVSIGINLLALPLYNKADKLQEKERTVAKKLENRVKQIKKTFKGNEQYMMLNAYYRENHYSPLYMLRGSLSILLEIPFFIAAYHFLSNCTALDGASFLFLKNLGSPDGLLRIGSISVNILPFVMTVINFVSGAVYTRDYTFREKIQLYVIALIFLVLLYNSPSGLVTYWIFNNVFSLAKNIIMKTKHPGKILHTLISVLLAVMGIYFFTRDILLWKKLIVVVFCLTVAVFPYARKYFHIKGVALAYTKKTVYLLFFSCLGLALLMGLLLPASVIASSPTEFSFLGNTDSPLTYIGTSFSLFFGLWVLWPVIIFFMFDKKVRGAESCLLFMLLLVCISNAYFFKSDYGNLSNLFMVQNTEKLSGGLRLNAFSFIVYGCIVFVSLMLYSKKNEYLILFAIVICSVELILGVVKTVSISNSYKDIQRSHTDTSVNTSEKTVSNIDKEYNLSKNEKNVVVLFLDRAIGSFAPMIFEEFPEIKKAFQGFTVYPNTISFSDYTVQAIPLISGGYEYTQEKMNGRDTELLRNKHDEALLVSPKLFSDAGFKTTVTDPAWSNYHSWGDLSPFSDYPEIKVSEIQGKYYDDFIEETGCFVINPDEYAKKGSVDFSVLQCMPPFLRSLFYNNVKRSVKGSDGRDFFKWLSNLYYLNLMTDFTSDSPTFTFIRNDATHDIDMMTVILNDDYLTSSAETTSDITLKHYQANVAVYLQIGRWLDYLRKNGAFDNTRIIIVSDHGRGVDIPNGDSQVAWYHALLMEKDFDSNSEVRIDNTFMTVADVLFLAKKGLSVSDINPFTGKKLVQEKENGVNIYHTLDWNAEHFRDAYKFELDKSRAWHVSDDIYDKENWIPLIEWEER